MIKDDDKIDFNFMIIKFRKILFINLNLITFLCKKIALKNP